jgi:tetratricopeptide (TPR) repeat protein
VQGKIYEENHESQKALTAYKQALEHEEVGSLHYEAAIRAGVLQYKLAESSVDLKQKALALLREAARLHAPRTEPLVTLARFLEAAGSHSSAIRCLSRLIHMNPSDPRAYVLRSQCLLLAGNSSGALRDRQTALLLDSRTDPDVMSGQIEALIESQDLIRALSKVNDSIARHPGHAHFKILYGKVLHLLGDIEGARKKFDEGIGSGNADSTDLESRGEFHLQTGSVPQAVQDFKASIQLDETNTSSYVSLGEARLRTGDSRGAADDLDGALQRQPNNKRALHLRAIVYEKEAKFSNALGIYKKMISILELEILKPTTMRDLLCKAKSHQEHEYYSFEAHMKA